MTTPDEPQRFGPLQGVRVLELATVVAGPGTGRYLADFGADVVKIESPVGDPTRQMGWTGPGEVDSYFWKLLNRNKRCITLDLKDPSDFEVFIRLVHTADVLIENMRPGKLEALGLAPERLHEENQRLVILRISGFGQTGPYAHQPGFATIAEALSGFADLLGEPDGGPLLPPIAVTDEVTALVGAFAVLAALRHAERSGEGQVVDVNLLESMFQIMGPLFSAYAHLGYLQPRLGSGIPYTVPRGTYECADGKWVAISSSSEPVAQRVLTLLGVQDDERFGSFQSRALNRAPLEHLMAEWVRKRPMDTVIEEFRNADAAIAPVLDMSDIATDPHFIARESFTTVDGIMMQNLIAQFSRTPGKIRHPGRGRGSDTQEVLDLLTPAPTTRET